MDKQPEPPLTQRIEAALLDGPATARDVSFEVFGTDENENLKQASCALSYLNRMGRVRRVGSVPSTG